MKVWYVTRAMEYSSAEKKKQQQMLDKYVHIPSVTSYYAIWR